ncbi:hypothetical protein LOC67_03660 [Stieleria sp. JC731]|uniref:hypothetical protein n=1 Tax=Pirellulaceae TaxID=2691357 RepID=UPI001E494BD4|nr:hypothetical protein [Stieleria sp. JC731]MCC9599646.1 hypothetical protein [Stieleria sp. JC731]
MHVIRLRRPWLRQTNDDAQPVRCDVPDTSDFHSPQTQTVLYERRFNCPTGLGDHSRVQLTVTAMAGTSGQISLNDNIIWTSPEAGLNQLSDPIQLQIKNHLAPTNRLMIEITNNDSRPHPEVAPILNGEVYLELDESA